MEINPTKRETTSEFVDGNRTFQINSFDPMNGNYILMQCLTFVLPMGIGNMLKSEVKGSEMIPTETLSAKPMSKADFISFQTDILSTVYEVYKSGEKSPVVRPNGTYGVQDVSMALLIKLLIASLAFNFKDFFKEFPSLKDLEIFSDSNL